METDRSKKPDMVSFKLVVPSRDADQSYLSTSPYGPVNMTQTRHKRRTTIRTREFQVVVGPNCRIASSYCPIILRRRLICSTCIMYHINDRGSAQQGQLLTPFHTHPSVDDLTAMSHGHIHTTQVSHSPPPPRTQIVTNRPIKSSGNYLKLIPWSSRNQCLRSGP